MRISYSVSRTSVAASRVAVRLQSLQGSRAYAQWVLRDVSENHTRRGYREQRSHVTVVKLALDFGGRKSEDRYNKLAYGI